MGLARCCAEFLENELQRGAPALADVVAVPGGDLNLYITFHDCLTSETGTKRQPRSHVEPVQLIIIGFRQIFLTFQYNHMAGSTGTAPAAGMFKMDFGVQRDV